MAAKNAITSLLALEGEPRYFLTYSGVKLPLKLSQPLNSDAITNRNTYFIGYFDAQDRMVAFQKIVYGEIELQHQYRFDAAGNLKQAIILDSEGEVRSMAY